MEKNNLNNKLEKDSQDQYKKLNIGLTSLSSMMGTALNGAFASIDSVVTEKQSIQYRAFMNKYIKLYQDGKIDAAEELKKEFSEKF